jgi:hypothetical protein
MAQIQVNVRWRDIPVFEDVLLSDVEGESAFLRTKNPLPVGTMLIVSPLSAVDVRVPTRVKSVIEIVEAGSDARQGMHVAFEAAAELLEPFLADEPQPLVGLEPEPALGAPQDGELEERDDQPIRLTNRKVETSPEGDLPAVPVVSVELPEMMKDSGLTPAVSGEINLGDLSAVGEDPDAPDKMIVEVEAGLPPEGVADEERTAFEADIETQPERPLEQEVEPKEPAEEPPAEQEAKANEEPKRKKRRKGRKRKKKT